MITDTKIKILGYIKTNGQARVKDLTDHLGIGSVAIHRHLKTLVEKKGLVKAGSAPKVFYRLPSYSIEDLAQTDHETSNLLDKYFAYVDPTGHYETGLTGFKLWANNVNKSDQIQSLLKRYSIDRLALEPFFKPQGWIDATHNVNKTFPHDMSMDGVYYLDFYSLPTFGKSRLGTIMLYSKQSENRKLIQSLTDEVKPMLLSLINYLNIGAIAYLPHSINRKVQFLKEFSIRANLPLPHIKLTKAYPGDIRVAQKTLGKLEERTTNARETIFIEKTNSKYDRVLLIDDAVGSGSTFNETAKKLKQLGIANQVFGFAIVGSLKGFEVVREV